MKKLITTCLTFGLFSAPAYIVYLFIWGTFLPAFFKPNLHYKIGAYGHTYSRLKEAKSIKNVDILFLGSSHAYRGFDSRIFKKYCYRSFNLGSNSQTPHQTRVLLKRYLDKLNPKIVILEVYPGAFCFDGVESSLDIISNDENDFYSARLVLETKNIKVLNTFLYGMIEDLLGLKKNYVEPPVKGNDKYVSGGYVEKDLNFFNWESTETKAAWPFKDFQFEAFDEMIDELKAKSFKTILVYAPITRSFYESHTNNEEFDLKMSSYGFDYYNFNHILSLQDSLDFFDRDHLNQYGVNIFNEKLVELLPGE